ncbi:GntR family transcriptional regulator [Cellulomonas soli]
MYTTSRTPAPARPSAADTVYGVLKARILDGELAGGDMVGEQALADELGVSRTPVREAIGRLQAEGWLRVHPRRGAVVTPVSPTERQDVLDARLLLETYGVRAAVDRGTTGTLTARLHEHLDAQRRAQGAGDLDASTEADADFHSTLAAAAGNGVLDGAFAMIRERHRRMTARALWRGDDIGRQVLTDHEHLIGLVEAGDCDGFATALAEHLRVHA